MEIVKIRTVAGSLVVSLPQSVLDPVGLKEGDRVIVQAALPNRLILSKERKPMTSMQHLELEIDLLEKKKKAVESDMRCKQYQHNQNMPTDEGMSDDSVAGLILFSLARDVDRLDVEIAEKRLELVEHGGASESALAEVTTPLQRLSTTDTTANAIRQHLIAQHFEPARSSGAKELTLRARDIHKELNFKGRMPAVCSVLGSKRLETEARVHRTSTTGPHQSSTTRFTFAIL